MTKKIYIGTSDFAKIIKGNGLFADKSLFIKEIIDSPDETILITRPRRWGKSLNMSMLHYFFSNETWIENITGMFDNLNIGRVDNGRYIQEHHGKYPVIFVSFKDVKAIRFSEVMGNLRILVQRLFVKHAYLLDSEKLIQLDKDTFTQYATAKIEDNDIAYGIRILSEYLYKHHNQKVYILMDEYDTPLNEAFFRGFADELTVTLRNMFSSALKDNNALQAGIMTGILRISKDSMLSGLNNLRVYTILDKKYNEYFGFTNAELDMMFNEQGLKRNEETVKSWYNGYNFAGCTIYNPWSILNCLQENGQFDEYWANTSNNQMIEKLLLEFRDGIQAQIIALLENKEVIVKIDKHTSFERLPKHNSTFWGLFLFSGYLTASNLDNIDEGVSNEYRLKIPNVEIRRLMTHFYSQWFEETIGVSVYKPFLSNLVNGNVEAFTEQLKKFLMESISIRDTGRLAENFYHGLVLGLISSLGNSHIIHSNRESGLGFPDVMLLPLPKSTLDLGIIMEFKHANNNEDLEQLATEALAQINARNYATELNAQPHIKRVLKLGLAFDKKQVTVVPQLD